MSLMQAVKDATGCVHQAVEIFDEYKCRLCGLNMHLVITNEGPRLQVIENHPVPEPACGECGAKHSDTDALYQVQGCVVDLENGVNPRSVARRMRRYLGMRVV